MLEPSLVQIADLMDSLGDVEHTSDLHCILQIVCTNLVTETFCLRFMKVGYVLDEYIIALKI